MPGLASMGLNPQAMMLAQLASGFLAPGFNQAQRISNGLANLGPAAMQMLQMQQFNKQLQKQQMQDDALARLQASFTGTSDPYAPMLSSSAPWSSPDLAVGPAMSTPPPTGAAASSSAPWVQSSAADQLSAAIKNPPAQIMPGENATRGTNVTMPKYSQEGDIFTIAPTAFAEAAIKNKFDPLNGAPDEYKMLRLYMQHPELVEMKQKMDPTSYQAFLDAYDNATPEQKEALLRRGATVIDMSERYNDQAMADVTKPVVADMQNAVTVAARQTPLLLRMKQAIEGGLRTGPTAGTRSFMTNILLDFGADEGAVNKYFDTSPENTTDFRSASNELTITLLKQFGPNPTEGERQFAEQIPATLATNPRAALRLINNQLATGTDAFATYGDFLSKMGDSAPAKTMRNAYDVMKSKRARQLKNVLAKPPGLPAGSIYYADDIEGNPIYMLPNGEMKRWRDE